MRPLTGDDDFVAGLAEFGVAADEDRLVLPDFGRTGHQRRPVVHIGTLRVAREERPRHAVAAGLVT
jgi:hypothetical protein